MSIEGIERRPYESKVDEDPLPPHPTEVPKDRMPTNRELDRAIQSITYGVDYGFDPPDHSVTYLTTDKKSQGDAVAELKGRTGKSDIETIAHGTKEGVLQHGGKSYDLNTEKGRGAYAKLLEESGLPKDQSQKIADVVKHAPKESRDEIAALALTWLKGETSNDPVPPRLALGNSKDPNTLAAVQNLAQAMPRAASQIVALEIHDPKGGVEFNELEGSLKNDWYKAFPNMQVMETFSRFEHHRSLRM